MVAHRLYERPGILSTMLAQNVLSRVASIMDPKLDAASLVDSGMQKKYDTREKRQKYNKDLYVCFVI